MREGFRIILTVLVISLLPAYSNADIEEKSSIIGSLAGAANAPISGVTVRLLDSFFLSEVAKTVTDENGKFTLSRLMPGLYLVSVDIPALSGTLKRVQVVSGSPTFIDLRSVLTLDQLKEHDAWDKFKWTIRVADRNPLREDETMIAQDTISRFSPAALDAFLDNVKAAGIKGEISYLNAAAVPYDQSGLNQITRVGVEGELKDGSWAINGHLFGGARTNYMASGDFQYSLNGHRVGASFSANDLMFSRYSNARHRQPISRWLREGEFPGLVDESKLWITSVQIEDEWQMLRQFRVDYGTRIDYYGYLEQPVSYSPRLEISYQINPNISAHALCYRNQSAPGNFFMNQPEANPYIHNVAFVPYEESLTPETAAGYEAGVDFTGKEFRVSVSYYAENITDKIASVDLSRSTFPEDAQEFNRPFVIFNARDIDSRGVQIEASTELANGITAVATYNVKQSVPIYILEKRYYTQRQLFFRRDAALQDFHDVKAGIQASLPRTLTYVTADWKWSSGSPLVFGNKSANTSLSSVDLEVHQGIPVHLFSDTQLKLMLAIKNLLDQNAQHINADFQRALLYSMPRMVAGGFMLQF